MSVPNYDEMFNPLLSALHALGGSGSNSEIDDKVAEILKLTEKEINEIHIGNRTQLSYRLAWARTYLKRYGLLENSSRGVWSLTSEGSKVREVDKSKINKHVKSLDKQKDTIEEKVDEGQELRNNENLWQDDLIEQLLKMDPSAFERLCQRILRESGFVQVEVTGKTGDGGVDGKGILKVNGFISFYITFQCKRYKGSVPSKEIRDFRGAMIGRSEKGLFITTGTFTKNAKNEAIRDGAPQIDLIDGEQLAEKIKELKLGIEVKLEEAITINRKWFEDF
ncbi:MAG: restriction endonuclease [Candidatus Pacebacteria bacterium]|nr:restriction endonuclease [Candidatus Paceibacterota bacterium]